MREGTKTIALRLIGLTREKHMEKINNIKEEKKEEQNHFRQHKLVFSRASECQSQFILWHKNYNGRKKDTIFCGHKKNTQRKKGIVFKKGQKKQKNPG